MIPYDRLPDTYYLTEAPLDRAVRLAESAVTAAYKMRLALKNHGGHLVDGVRSQLMAHVWAAERSLDVANLAAAAAAAHHAVTGE